MGKTKDEKIKQALGGVDAGNIKRKILEKRIEVLELKHAISQFYIFVIGVGLLFFVLINDPVMEFLSIQHSPGTGTLEQLCIAVGLLLAVKGYFD